MCGISGRLFTKTPVRLASEIGLMNMILAHRGPDDAGEYVDAASAVALGHRRLSIIGDSSQGHQPLHSESGHVMVFNGEIYNYVELLEELDQDAGPGVSDSMAILHAYQRWGEDCVDHFRGMFAFAIWDPHEQRLFCARDRFGIKPFYYHRDSDGEFTFASEMKAILPFLAGSPRINHSALREYLTFQFCLHGKTLFEGVEELPAAHTLVVDKHGMRRRQYWEVEYGVDFSHTARWFLDELGERLDSSMKLHLRSDVPVGAYVSGGIDSSGVAALAQQIGPGLHCGFNGRFDDGPEFDESNFARDAAALSGYELVERTMHESDFVSSIESIIYHLDTPIAGPGSVPQFLISEEAARHCKVVLGGQGGDEIFGGYTRYLIAYFEQCIKAAIDGTSNSGNFVLTYESIIPALSSLRRYKPMLKSFWEDGLFESLDRRYFRLVNRAPDIGDAVRWHLLTGDEAWGAFDAIFNASNTQAGSYFDRMTHFDLKTLLPALLHVEDRMSMAHGLESRVPLLDHPIVELASTVPADIKFENGDLKHLLKRTLAPHLPTSIMQRTDKMGFPIPLNSWLAGDGPAAEFVLDIFTSQAARDRELFDYSHAEESIKSERRFGRTTWGLLGLELWQRTFLDGHRTAEELLRETAVG